MTLAATIADKLRQAIPGDERVKESMYQIDIDDTLELTCDIDVKPLIEEYDNFRGEHIEEQTGTWWQIKSGSLFNSETETERPLTDDELEAIETILNK